MLVLDTNVVSELMRTVPAPAVLAWLDGQAPDNLWLTSVSAAELLFGLARLDDGARKRALMAAATRMLAEDFGGRVLPFDLEAATVFAQLATERERAGQRLNLADGQIAATCLAHGATLATRNERHFTGLGLEVVNPCRVARGNFPLAPSQNRT